MSTAKIYTIHYQLHGQPKSFVVRAEVMNNACLLYTSPSPRD